MTFGRHDDCQPGGCHGQGAGQNHPDEVVAPGAQPLAGKRLRFLPGECLQAIHGKVPVQFANGRSQRSSQVTGWVARRAQVDRALASIAPSPACIHRAGINAAAELHGLTITLADIADGIVARKGHPDFGAAARDGLVWRPVHRLESRRRNGPDVGISSCHDTTASRRQSTRSPDPTKRRPPWREVRARSSRGQGSQGSRAASAVWCFGVRCGV